MRRVASPKPPGRGPACQRRGTATTGLLALACLAGGSAAWAQATEGGAGRPAFTVTPRIAFTQSYTDNATLSSNNTRTEWITQIAPGVRIVAQGARVQGTLDYSLNEFVYANNTRGSQRQNALNASGAVELVDRSLFVDFSGQISQQSISAFGATTTTAGSVNANATETANFRLSPYLQGIVGGAVEYVLRYDFTSTDSKDARVSDVRSGAWSASLSGVVSGPLSWSAGASSKSTRYSLGRTLDDEQIQGALNYTFSPQFRVSLRGTQSSDNFSGAGRDSQFYAGLSADWALSQATRLSAQIDRRSFGHSHSLSFEHRTGRTAWRFSDSQSASDAPSVSGLTVAGTLGDLLFAQFASLEPDPVKRALLVEQFTQANGLQSDSKIISGFLSTSATLQRSQSASFVLLGVRDTVSFVLSRSANSRLDRTLTALDDLQNNSRIKQFGFTTSWAHRLTPDASFNLSLGTQRTDGTTGAVGTSLRTLDFTLLNRFGRNWNGSVGARRVWFDSTTAPYSETAITGSLSVQF